MENERVIFLSPGVICAALSNYVIVILLLFLITFIVFFSMRQLYHKKYETLEKQIRQKIEREKQEVQFSVETEQQMMKFLNEQLRSELESKNRELANSAMSIVYKNELLQKIRHEIFELKDTHGKKLSSDQLRRIDKIINEAISKEGDWNLFERSFNDAHENFFKKLKANHNGLAPNDLKLCAFLRMNMNSKEIASLLNISLRGVEIRRYRLRKKLDVRHDKNLSEFLLEI